MAMLAARRRMPRNHRRDEGVRDTTIFPLASSNKTGGLFRVMHQLHRSVVRVPLAALAVLLIGAGSAAPAGNARLSAIRIDNFGIINDHYYRGAQPGSADYPDLAALGVKTVIDLTRDGRADEKALVEAAGMKFMRIPLTTTEAPT